MRFLNYGGGRLQEKGWHGVWKKRTRARLFLWLLRRWGVKYSFGELSGYRGSTM